MSKNYIKLPNVNGQKIRREYYSPDSFKHPAKADILMMIWILKKFVKDGDVVLDPMAGIGSTLIEGIKLFPNSLFIGVELEDKFVKMTQASIKKTEEIAKKDWFAEVGKAICIKGDARDLEKVLREKVDKIISSPPYVDTLKGSGYKAAQKRIKAGKYKGQRPDVFFSKGNIAAQGFADGYPKNKKNIGNLPFGKIDKIITSPPFGQAQSGGGIAKKGYHGKHGSEGLRKGHMGSRSYTPENIGDKGNISNLPYINKIITSPPYEEAMGDKHHSPAQKKLTQEKSLPNTYTDKIDKVITSPPYERSISPFLGGAPMPEDTGVHIGCRNIRDGYGRNRNNIGNLKSQTYLEAMFLVYQECFKILKPQGIMILITKDFIRNKKRIPLGEHTIKLCQMAGFKHFATYHRKIENPSFWRILYKQKFPEVEQINCEDIVCFKKD